MDAGKPSKPSGAPDKRAENFNATKGRSENIFSGGPKSKPELNDIGGSESFLTACGNEIAAWEKISIFGDWKKKNKGDRNKGMPGGLSGTRANTGRWGHSATGEGQGGAT